MEFSEPDNKQSLSPQPTKKQGALGKFFAQAELLPTIWTVGSGLSILLNLILVIMLIVVSRQMFALKSYLQNDLVGGLYYNFILMDEASIVTKIQIKERISVKFDMPLKQNTIVTLTEATAIQGATISLTTGGLNIVNAPTDIVLPAGTVLPIKLDLVIPVDTTIPIRLTVPIEIPLNTTELHTPFVGLQEVVAPLYRLLQPLPNSWGEIFSKSSP